jgi:hypothetical protein
MLGLDNMQAASHALLYMVGEAGRSAMQHSLVLFI